jgi:xylulokinase
MTALLGIDIGTTATKAILLDPDRGPIAEAERPVELVSSHPGWAEEDPAMWWRNVGELCHELADGHEIAGIGVSGMVPCTILLDGERRPLRWSIQQNDARSSDEVAELTHRLDGHRVLMRTGSAITQQSTGPRLLWLAKHEPETWTQAKSIVGSYDFIVGRLTGNLSVESNWALETGLYDLETRAWAADVLQASGAAPSLLPEIRRPEEVVGHVSREGAQHTGLAEGTPVVAGTADHIGSAFAAGVLRDGDLLIKLGGAGDILLAADEPSVDERLYLDFHLIPGHYVLSGCMATSGTLIRWFQAQLGCNQDLGVLDQEADAAGPGAGGVIVLPYFLGEKTPINDPDATGAFVGLRLGHTRGHIFRAILQATAFGFRHHLDVLRDRGHVVRKARVTDGGARSRVWTQITADVLGLPLEKVNVRSGSALAAAFVAGMGVGAFRNWFEIERFITVTEVVEPSHYDIYDEQYRAYRALYPALKEVLA